MHQVDLFGTMINLRSEHCTKNNSPIAEKISEPYINMYVKLQNHCNAQCKFCEYRGEKRDFNLGKFNTILKEVKKKVRINKISFTGGEPTLNVDLLWQTSQMIKSIDKNIFTVVNTNGINLHRLTILDVDSIALSRHHYLDEKNNEILGFNAPSKDVIEAFFGGSHIIHLSCNLIKGYIDSEEEVIKYLEFCNEVGVSDVGLVSLMKVNEYCKNHHIDFDDLDLIKYPNIIRNRIWNNKNSCRCANYLYASPNYDNITKLYSRYYVKQNNLESQLVFDGQNLRDGFNGKIII